MHNCWIDKDAYQKIEYLWGEVSFKIGNLLNKLVGLKNKEITQVCLLMQNESDESDIRWKKTFDWINYSLECLFMCT